MKCSLVVSLVLFRNSEEDVKKTIQCVLDSNLNLTLFLVDNSPDDRLRSTISDNRVKYIFNNGQNLGFGAAHNIAIESSWESSDYHLVLNPDISFSRGTLENILSFLEANPDVGLLLPKVLNFQSELQFVCKRLPSPLDLIIRRLGLNTAPLGILEKKAIRYEMRDKDYHSSFDAPALSGCFMFIRTKALRKVGLFDDRYFMYMEDFDLSRRIHKHYRTVYNPSVHILHGHARSSYKFNKLFIIHIQSAIKYFNKWGWLFDKERIAFNNNV